MELSLYPGGPAANRLRQGKLNIIPVPECQNFFTDFWEDVLPFKVPYEAPVTEINHVCAGQVDAHIDACYVSGLYLQKL